MPLYEYECEKDGYRFEVIQKFSDAPVTTCTQCGGPVRRLLSSPAIQFKGSGWYITDYARKGGTDYARKSETEPGKDAAKDAKSSASSESPPKPASESAPKPSSTT